MAATGNQPPAMFAPRAKFVAADLRRNATFFNVPLLDAPMNFFTEVAKANLVSQRLICAAQTLQFSQTDIESLVDSITDGIHLDPAHRSPSSTPTPLSASEARAGGNAGGNTLTVDRDFLLARMAKAGLDETQMMALERSVMTEEPKALLKASTTWIV